jgi:hypothetical protein
MPASERRFWPGSFQDHHILGEVKYVNVGEARVRALMLYEQSIGRGVEPTEDVLLRGRVIGSMDAIRCTICGRVHNWIIGQDAMDAFMESLGILGLDMPADRRPTDEPETSLKQKGKEQ